MKRCQRWIIHLCMICSFICIITKVLDWYNPYMDFGGHTVFAEILLYVGVFLLEIIKNK